MDIKYVSLGKAATRRQYSYSGPVNTPRKLFLLNSAHTLAQKVFLFISTVVCILSISQQSIKNHLFQKTQEPREESVLLQPGTRCTER